MQKPMLLMMIGMWAMPAVAGGRAALPVEPQHKTQPAGKILWRTSLAALTAANAMDVRSSWGKHELNPSLSGDNGRFGREGALIKLGILGGMFAVESLILRRQPSAKFYRGLAIVNFGSASVTGAIAIRNFGVPRP